MFRIDKGTIARLVDGVSLLIAAGLVISPFVFETNDSTIAIRNQVMVGALFGIFTAWLAVSERKAARATKAR